MDAVLLLKFFSAFVFVMTLMLGLAWLLKRMGQRGLSVRGPARRLEVVEYLPLDHRRRLVLVRRDDREHLLVLGPQGETVVETGIALENGHVVAFSREAKNVKI